MKPIFKKSAWYFLWAGLLMMSACGERGNGDRQVFRLLDANDTGISFVNAIQEDVSSKSNLFDFDYFYNGAGVGVADINNDGLQDIFFCANQETNRLYLNKGNLQFEDISDAAGINEGKQWSNGVTFADVNGDSYLDIYVSQGGPYEAENRKNLLFINNGDLTFTESAAEFGLADQSITTQSAFFDYDKDGDLDCFVMNENPLYGVEPVQFHQMMFRDKDLAHESSSHLYRNDDGVFEDVTLSSGVYRPAYGLGLAISDINDDGWLDIYVANDYYLPDNLFINNGEGFFIDQIASRTNQVSFYGMGVDIADINGDLLQDIFVLDMASSDHKRSKTLMASMNPQAFDMLVNGFGFQSQYMFNSLQLNDGEAQFDNIAHFGHMAKTDWSWAVLMQDFDGDSYKDIYVTNGYRRYALDNDLKNEVADVQRRYIGEVPIEVKTELYNKMPSEKLPNLMYRGSAEMDFEEVATAWGMGQPTFSNGTAFADLDNDGDLDIVVNNMDEVAQLFENTSSSGANFLQVALEGALSEPFAKVTITYGDGLQQMQEVRRVRGYMSAVQDVAHFGLGAVTKVDEVQVEWLDGSVSRLKDVPANERVVISQADAEDQREETATDQIVLAAIDPADLGIDYGHVENSFDDFEKEVLLPYKQSTLGPAIEYDEASEMLFIAGAKDQPFSVYKKGNDDRFELIVQPTIGPNEDMAAAFFDLENDGSKELFVVSGGNELPPGSAYYKDRMYAGFEEGAPRQLPVDAIEEYAFSGKVVRALDYDRDGWTDLIVGNRIVPQNYPLPATSYLLRNNEGELVAASEEVIPQLENFGIVNDILVTDFDADGWQDLVVIGEWTQIGLFRNEEGQFRNITEEDSTLSKMRGWWYSVAETDVNQDGLPDYVLGNVGLNTKFTASLEKPFKVFAADFDKTGSLDVVLSKVYKDEYVPVRGRECSSQQMPFIKSKFPTYEEFADATITDIFDAAVMENSYKAEATDFASMVLINRGDRFEPMRLPWQAQLFPVLDMVCEDFDGDGVKDVLLAGNIYDTEVETPRWDFKSGQILYAKDGEFVAGPSLRIPGDVKDLEVVEMDSRKVLLVARNNAELLAYDLSSARRSL